MKKNKFIILGVFIFALLFSPIVNAQFKLDPITIYRQAKLKNYRLLNRLSSHNKMFNITNRFGDTAYCVAMKYNDIETMDTLRRYGANTNHSCVKRIRKENQAQDRTQAPKRVALRTHSPIVSSVASNSNYLLWGLGAVAVGGGIAVASSGGGGGSSSNNSNPNNPDEPNIPDIPDEPNIPDNPDTPDIPNADSLYDISAEKFENDEYNKGNFLDDINASSAYSHIYKKDKDGNIIGYQSGSNALMEKVKVGVIDSGVYHNDELKDKIVSEYDINMYNNDQNTKVFTRDGIHYFVIENGSKYYFLPVDTLNLQIAGRGSQVLTSIDELNVILNAYYGISYNDFVTINSGGGHPGVRVSLSDDYQTWWSYLNDLSHGTHVAGIIAGSKDGKGMHGVAFDNAEIVAGSWDLDQDIYATVVNMVDEGVKVINNSWGNPVTSIENATTPDVLFEDEEDILYAYSYAANKGAVWVQATGNQGKTEGGVHNAIGGVDLTDYGYAGPKQYEAPYVAVAALDGSKATESAPSGMIADYSNRCGVASNWCIAAPGTDVVSSDTSKDGHMLMKGTSMATPVVSGSIALLQGYYPWLKAQNIAYLLLETANNRGEYAKSEIYGQGALDLEAAITTPIGELGLPENQNLDSLKKIGLTKLSTSSVMQNQLLKAMPKTITAFDALKRPFEYETSKLINTTHSSNANLRNTVSRMAMGDSGVKTIKDERTGFQFSTSQKLNNGGNAHLSTMEVVNEGDTGATRFYYAENSKYMKQDDAIVSDNNPYLAMREAYGAENTLNLSDTSKLKLSLQTGENGLYERDEEQDHHSFDERSYAMNAEYSFNLTDYLEVATLGGMLFEEDAMLGLNGVGGFGIQDSSTYYMGLKAKLDLTNKVSLIAAYYRGYTSGSASSMLAISNLETESFMLAGEYNLNRNHKFGLMLSSPMSVVKGNASIMYASGRDNNSNNAYLKQLKASLKPEAKEYDLGMYYKGKPSEDLSLSGKVEARFNADGEKGVMDYMGVVGAQYVF